MEDASEEQPRQAARAGRRARQPAFTEESQDPPEEGRQSFRERSDGGAAQQEDPSDDAPLPPKRGGFESPRGTSSVGGYGDNIPRPPPAEIGEEGTKFVGVSRRKQDQRQREEDEKVKAKSKYDELAEKAMPIDSILEIEEEGKEDLTGVVAEAPKVRVNKVQDFNELNKDMQYTLPSMEDRDIDLSLLTSFLCSSAQVEEGDDPWDPDMLFTAVASELHQEKEKAEGPTEKDSKDGDGGGMGGQL